ncbi:MAG: BPSS1780 family membrane protein [Betaproteobacteria bacterium]
MRWPAEVGKMDRMKLIIKPVQARQGVQWVVQALKVFGRQPLGLAGLFGTFLFLALVLMLVPVIGGVVVLAAVPLLGLVMMMGTAAVVRGQRALPGLYLAPFRADAVRRSRLLVLCAAYGALSLLVLLVSEAIDGGKLNELQELMAAGRDDARTREELQRLLADPQLLGGLYARVGLTALISIPFWHAPALVWWGQQSAAQALFSSTLAIWRSKGAFVSFVAAWVSLLGVSGLGLGLVLQALGLSGLMGVLAMPLGLTLSVIFYASLYFSFVQTFGTGEAGSERTDEDAPDEISPPA